MKFKNSIIHFGIYTVCFISCCFPLIWASAFAAEKNPQKKLQLIKEELVQISQDLNISKKNQNQQIKNVRAFDVEIANLSSKLTKTVSMKKDTSASMATLKVSGKALTEKITANQLNLASIVRALYELGDKNYLKIIMNQSNASEQSRMLDYFDYFYQAFTRQQAQLNKDLIEIGEIDKALTEKAKEYESIIRVFEKETDRLKEKRENKKVYLVKLEQKIKTKRTRLKRLKSSQKTLEKVLKALKKRKHREEMARLSGMSFAKNKGKLQWPVTGKVQNRFGQTRAKSGLKWRGYLISAKAGEKVKAIEGGTIVFADWLSGYGFVLIIDHSKGYMSLYGHNQQLLKEVADKVKAGDVIAEAGNSGRLGKPGLYFEIRRNGKPVNPKKWMAARKSR